MRKIPFVKYTSYGNNFVIIDETSAPVFRESEKPQFAYRATSVDYGIGSDNFLIVQACSPDILKEINATHHYWDRLPSAADADYIFRMFEPDGKEAFSCGNGLLCISDYLYRKYGVKSGRMMTEIPTSAPGIVTVGTDCVSDMKWSNMGHPRRIPSEMKNSEIISMYNNEVEITKEIRINFPDNGLTGFSSKISLTLRGYLVFTGEPHLVAFTESGFSSEKLASHIFRSGHPNLPGKEIIAGRADFSSRLVHQIGMCLNNDYPEYFPMGVNVNFARVLDSSGLIEYRCFERGICRETQACGTGAVACAFVAGHLKMLTSSEITVLPFRSRLHDPDARICVKKKENNYILYGKPVLLLEGEFFV